MADIHVHRSHAFGLTRARAIALSWAEELEERYGMDCTIHEGEDSDTVTFVREGVDGSLEVSGDSFELQARLGFLLSAFRKQIEAEVGRVLDALLAKEAGVAAKTKVKTAPKDKGGKSVPAGKPQAPAAAKPRRR